MRMTFKTMFQLGRALPVSAASFFLTSSAFASSSGGGTLPWEGPLTTIKNSLTGPVAFAISLMGLVAGGAVLIWGGDISEFFRRMVYLVMVIALLALATNVMTALFSGASVL